MKTTKQNLMRFFATHQDREIRFVANVVMTSCDQVAKKLKAMYQLLESGHEIHSGNYVDTLRIDGEQHSLSILDDLSFVPRPPVYECPTCGATTTNPPTSTSCQRCERSAHSFASTEPYRDPAYCAVCGCSYENCTCTYNPFSA